MSKNQALMNTTNLIHEGARKTLRFPSLIINLHAQIIVRQILQNGTVPNTGHYKISDWVFWVRAEGFGLEMSTWRPITIILPRH